MRVLSHEAGAVVKGEGRPNDLIERVVKDEFFKPIHADMETLLDPSTFTGRAPQQVDKFLREEVAKAVESYSNHLVNGQTGESNGNLSV